MSSTKKAHVNKFIWGLRFVLKDRIVNQWPQSVAPAMEIACLWEEVLNEHFGAVKKDKEGKTTVNSNNSRNVTNSHMYPWG